LGLGDETLGFGFSNVSIDIANFYHEKVERQFVNSLDTLIKVSENK
jgi:hypothetical protein